jgi:hypothetical protein
MKELYLPRRPNHTISIANGDTLEWPRVELIAPRRIRLLQNFRVEWTADGFPRQALIIPAGFECDGGSVPAAAEWYLGRDNILPAAVPHDFQYYFQGKIPLESHLFWAHEKWTPAYHIWSRDEVDRFFARNLQFCKGLSDKQRRRAYQAVHLFGGRSWGK